MVKRRVTLVVRSVRSGKVRRIIVKVVRVMAPGLIRRRVRRNAVRRGPVLPGGQDDPLLMAAQAQRLQYRPLLSVLVPVYNTAPALLDKAVRSVLEQAYTEWELLLSDDGSSRTDTLAALQGLASADPRVRILHAGQNQGIAKATNAALAQARGEFIALLDHDDELLPGALFEAVKTLNADRTLDVVYTDQDQIEADGSPAQTFYKPDWSLELFRGVMYVGHLLVVRRSLADEVGGFDPAFDRVQDYEFMLRIAEKTTRITHVPKILYHWRKVQGSVAMDVGEKGNIEPLQEAAVNAHLARCGVAATARSNPNHDHRLQILPRRREHYPLTSLIISAEGTETHIVATCKNLIAEGTYPHKELLVTGGQISPKSQQELLSMGVALAGAGLVGSAALAAGLRQARGHLLVSLVGDLEVETLDWLEHLLFLCELPTAGCVTPVILSADGNVASAGSFLGGPRVTLPAMSGWQPGTDGYCGSLSCVREVSSVPGDCFALTRDALDKLGGLNPYLAANHYQAVDLSLRALSAGMRNLCTPRVLVRHRGSRPGDQDHDALDALLLCDAWRPLLLEGDPYHNRNFKQESPGYLL
jgi:GT2 family glycosyltransferase